MPGTGNSQTIGGRSYQMYSPEWYNAQRGNTVQKSATAGAAQGTEVGSFWDALPASLKGLEGGSGGSTSSASGTGMIGAPSVSFPGAMGGMEDGASTPPSAHMTPVDFTAANTAAFARAKDQAAQTSRAALTALSGELQSRGMGGAGYEGGQIGHTLSREANTIGEASRSEALSEANLSAQAESENFRGGIEQRGQDITAQTANANRLAEIEKSIYSGGIAQRGQDLGAQEAGASLSQNDRQFQQRAWLEKLRAIMSGLHPTTPEPLY